MKLYEYDQMFARLIETAEGAVDCETGELFSREDLDALAMEREKKIEQCIFAYKNYLSDAKAKKEEIKRLKAGADSDEGKAEWMKQYIAYSLNGEKFKTALTKVSYRKSTAVEIGAGAQVPEEFLKAVAPTVNKEALKKALQAGEKYDGIQLVERQNIQIG